MFDVALALVTAGDDDRQAVLFAQAVAGPGGLLEKKANMRMSELIRIVRNLPQRK